MPGSILAQSLAIVLKLLGTGLSCAIALILCRLLCHPLAKVPGPRLAALSNVWHAYHVRNGRMLMLGKTLHKKYGPVVRVGPNEVWFDSREAFSKIYGERGGYAKSEFYVALALHRPRITSSFQLSFPNTLDLLGEFDMERYSLQRRLIGPLYHKRSLLKHEKAIDDVLLQAIAEIASLQSAEVDLKEWMHIIVVECLTAVVLSWSPGYLRDKTDHGSGSHAYLGWRRKSVFGLFPCAEILDGYCRTLGRIFARCWRLTYQPPPHFKALFPLLGSKTSKRVSASLRPNPPKDKRTDLAAELIQLHKDKSDFTADYLKRMIMTNFGAGHETTTSALTSAILLIASDSTVKRKLVSEIESSMYDVPIIPYFTASSFPYIQSAIKEAQRLHPVIGMSLPRTVPSAGLCLHDQYFPPGTVVGCNPIAFHRNPSIFGSDAEDYRPDRWLENEARRRDMERSNLIYGGGARSCPGRNLAEIIVLKVVTTLVQHFEIELSKMPGEEDIRYYFMAMLTGVKVKFRKRSGGEERGKEEGVIGCNK